LGFFKQLIIDARYEKVRLEGTVRSCAVLIAIGIDARGRRAVIGLSAKLSEAEVHWRDFLGSLQARGLHGVEFIVSDDHAGLRAALTARFPSIAWQRCQFHLQQNAMAYVPQIHLRESVAQDVRSVFNAADLPEAQRRLKTVAEKYQASAPQLAAWLEVNVPESLTVLKLPEKHRKKLRTTNSLERLNKEIKRRTRVATLFPNEKSLERLVTALLSEISDEWHYHPVTANIVACKWQNGNHIRLKSDVSDSGFDFSFSTSARLSDWWHAHWKTDFLATHRLDSPGTIPPLCQPLCWQL
jgi:transposase-like protein